MADELKKAEEIDLQSKEMSYIPVMADELKKTEEIGSQPKQLSYIPVVSEEQSQKLSLLALDCFNEAARLSREQEYSFLKIMCCNCFTRSPQGAPWYHLNFIGRADSQKGTEIGEHVFFAELGKIGVKTEVMRVLIVGSTSQVTPRLSGCANCDMFSFRDMMVHPIGRDFGRLE